MLASDKKVLLETPIFTVVEKTIENSDFHPLSIECPDWVLVYAYDGENMLLVRQTRWGIEKETVEFPCGTVEKGEKPVDAAKRELLEETGIDAELEYAGGFNPNPATYSNTMHVFRAFAPDLEEKFKYHKELHLDKDEDCKPFVAHKHYRMTDSAVTLAAKQILGI